MLVGSRFRLREAQPHLAALKGATVTGRVNRLALPRPRPPAGECAARLGARV